MAIPKARVRYKRPEQLSSRTYKIHPPISEHAFYITISDGEIDEQIRPVEIFINTKDLQNQSWVSAFTRLLSAQFQQPGPFSKWIIAELLDTYDAGGGYFIPGGGGRVNSIVAHVGKVIEQHCKELKLL